MYPANWPRCPVCEDFAMDGHITCGRFECNEPEERRKRDAEHWAIHDAIYGWDDADSYRAMRDPNGMVW